jgi:PHP domain
VLKAAAGLVLIAAVGITLVVIQRSRQPRFERTVPWANSGLWLNAETHVHSKFSDGAHTIDELATRAVANGCDVLAITDHTDANLTAATPEYHAAIAAARSTHPNLVLVTGFEWNVPPGKGQDHAVVLAPPQLESPEVWAEFKRRFDDLDKEGENPELAAEGFKWLLARSESSEGQPVVVLDHPGRRAASVDAVAQELEFLLRVGGPIFVGVEGAPGHQNATPLGAYGGVLKPEDRWDPAIVAPGGAWDRLLAAGRPVWGALATSDFHSEQNGDYWPCQFSTTQIYAPERSAVAVLEALRAGSFVGIHGGIARDVQVSLTADGLPRSAIAGETVRIRSGTQATVEIRGSVPAADWNGLPNRLDAVDLIGVTRQSATILHSGSLDAQGVMRHTLSIPTGGVALRARGRRIVEEGPDLLFYTNPIMVREAR